MRGTLPITIALGWLALIGCATDQAADVERYRTLTPVHVEASVSTLSLEQALALTAERNEQLAIEGERYIQALSEIERRTSSLLPTLDLGATFTARDQAGDGSRETLFDAGPTAQYTLLTGMGDRAEVDAATRDAEERRWTLLDLREGLLLTTAQAYYTATAAERLIEVLRSSMGVQEERLRDIRARQEVGLARPLDVAQIEAQVSRTRTTLLEAERAAHDARTALAFVTGADVASLALTDGWALDDALDRERLLAVAGDRRQDLRAAEQAVYAARERVDAAIGQYAPTVRVNLEYFLTRQSVPTERDWTAILSLEVPIFSAGRIEAEVRAAWSRFRESLLRLSLLRRRVTADVDLALERVRSTGARVAEFSRLVELARETLRQAEGSYAAGLGTNLERLVAQDSLLSAQLELAIEEAERKVASLGLLRSTGTLAEGSLRLPQPPPSPDAGPLPDSPFVRIAPPPSAAPRTQATDATTR